MGLAINITCVSRAKDADPEGGEWLERDVAAINQLLASEEQPLYIDPSDPGKLSHQGSLDGFPYSWIHYLRRVLAYHNTQPALTPVVNGADPTDDPVLQEEYFMLDSHLICHSDAEGYYVPVDFPATIYGSDKYPITGGMLGSSYGLRRELLSIAPLIEIELVDEAIPDQLATALKDENMSESHAYYRERQVWFTLYESANLSIQHGMLIQFC